MQQYLTSCQVTSCEVSPSSSHSQSKANKCFSHRFFPSALLLFPQQNKNLTQVKEHKKQDNGLCHESDGKVFFG